MDKTLVKNIAFFAGCIAIFAAGILYVLLADWILTTQSLWLMLAIILSVGSAACVMLSAKFKGHHKAMYALKGVAIGLAVSLIAFFVAYLVVALAPEADIDFEKLSAFQRSFAIKSVYGDIIEKNNTLAVFIVVLVINVIALASQVVDLVLTAIIKEE